MLNITELRLLSEFCKCLIEMADMYESEKLHIDLVSKGKSVEMHCINQSKHYKLSDIPMNLIRYYSEGELSAAAMISGASPVRRHLEMKLCNSLYLFLKEINARGITPEEIKINIEDSSITTLQLINDEGC